MRPMHAGLFLRVLPLNSGHQMRKVIEFDDETYQVLVQLGRDRMATLQELADEAFADLLKKHGVPIDLKDALRKSVRTLKPAPARKTTKHRAKRT